MSNIEELIQQLCPDGVEFKELAEIALVSGAGVDKKINESEIPITLLNFMDVFRNQYIDSKTPKMRVTTTENKIKQCNVLKGDIFITPSSEVKNEIGFSAVAIEDMPGVVYSYHIMRIRMNEFNIVQSMFINYLFRSEALQDQINKNAKGLTRFGLTKAQWEKIQIPIPPLPIQQEIVNILDKFTQLEAELEAELEARARQYEFYRNQLLNFDGKDVEWKTLDDVCLKTENIKWKDAKNKDYKYIDLTSVSRDNNKVLDTQFINSSNAPSRAQQIVRKNDVIFGTTRPTLRRYSLITSEYDNQICSTGFCVLRANETLCIPKFLFFLLTTSDFYSYVENNQEGAGYPSITNSKVKKFPVPIPSISEQERIVSILDKFDALVNDISIGLPSEIEARRKQYEYYRGKLLNFKNVNNG